MSRSKWKGFFVDKNILEIKKETKKKQIKIWARNSTIPYSLIDKTVLIYNGKEFKKIQITKEKVGYKFGEFCSTRKHIIKKENE